MILAGGIRDLGSLRDGEPEILPYDATLPYERSGALINRGCPDGYFAQFVPSGTPGAVYVQIPELVQGSYMRCRLMATTTAQTNAEETGQLAAESWYNFTNTGPGAWLKSLLDQMGMIGKIGLGVVVVYFGSQIVGNLRRG